MVRVGVVTLSRLMLLSVLCAVIPLAAIGQPTKFGDRSKSEWDTRVYPELQDPPTRHARFQGVRKQTPEQILVEVLYSTDRYPVNGLNVLRDDCKFEEARNHGGLSYGIAFISRPKFITAATLGRDLRCIRIKPLTGANALAPSSLEMSSPGVQDAFFYVHGHNTTLGQAAEAGALLSGAISKQNLPIIFSWPARTGIFTYIGSMDEIAGSKANLYRVLGTILTNFRNINVHVLGHSLGARVVSETFSDNNPSTQRLVMHGKLSTIMLAAADISTQSFDDGWPSIERWGTRVLVYASMSDPVLAGVTECVGGTGTRLGQLEGPWSKWVSIDFNHVKQTSIAHFIPWCRLQTVEAYFRSSLHNYHYENAKVRQDISQVVSGALTSRTVRRNRLNVREID